MNIVWKGGKDAYHIMCAREQYKESDYLHALASVIQQDNPEVSYTESMSIALAIDGYIKSVNESRKIGQRTHDLLKQRHALRYSKNHTLTPS